MYAQARDRVRRFIVSLSVQYEDIQLHVSQQSSHHATLYNVHSQPALDGVGSNQASLLPSDHAGHIKAMPQLSE